MRAIEETEEDSEFGSFHQFDKQQYTGIHKSVLVVQKCKTKKIKYEFPGNFRHITKT